MTGGNKDPDEHSESKDPYEDMPPIESGESGDENDEDKTTNESTMIETNIFLKKTRGKDGQIRW